MIRYLVDTNVFVYARGGAHPYREACRDILREVAEGHVTLDASVALVQEFAHLLLRRGANPAEALDEVDEVRSVCRIHELNLEVWDVGTGLLRRHPGLGVRDAVHAGTALHVGLPQILSTDHAFDDIDGVARVDPASAQR